MITGWLDEVGGTTLIFDVIGVIELAATCIFVLDYWLMQRKSKQIYPIQDIQRKWKTEDIPNSFVKKV